MKHGCKPTYAQRKLMDSKRLNTYDWLVIKDTPTELVLVSRYNDKVTKVISKVVKI